MQVAKWSTKSFFIFYFFFVTFFFIFFLALRTYTSVDNISIYSYIHNEYVYIPVMHSLYILIFFRYVKQEKRGLLQIKS